MQLIFSLLSYVSIRRYSSQVNEIHDVCGKGLMAESNSRKNDGTLLPLSGTYCTYSWLQAANANADKVNVLRR